MTWEFPEFICNLPEVDINLAGVSGHVLQGKRQQAVFLRFDQDVEVPEHSHRAQWELVLAGEVRLRAPWRTCFDSAWTSPLDPRWRNKKTFNFFRTMNELMSRDDGNTT